MIPKPRALVFSPSASHPQDYGNRNRVWQVTQFLKEAGYAVDFILYPFEAEWTERIPAEIEDMRAAWDSFWIAPPTVALHRRAKGEYHEIDEWWDDSIGNLLTWLFSRRSYDVFLVNYTFFSKALTFAPPSVVRILETHDRFSGRKEMLESLGVAPEFFYTTPERERIAFDRADIVVAIKDSEAIEFEALTERTVLPLPFFPTRTLSVKPRSVGFAGLSVGFVGALNNVNTANMQAFLSAFDRMMRYYCPPLQLLIAGDVCIRLKTTNPAIKLLGKVPNIEDFYDSVDVVVAPMTSSTGIKIKVGEALSFGKGVVSTVNGFDGYPAVDSMHRLGSLDQVGRSLIRIAHDKERRAELIANSQISARLSQRSTAGALQHLAHAIQIRTRRIVFVCDQPFWARSSLAAARRAQWFEFCKFTTSVVVLYLRGDDGDVSPAPEAANVVEIDVRGKSLDEAAQATVAQMERALTGVGGADVMLSLDHAVGPALAREAAARGYGVFLDLWIPHWNGAAAGENTGQDADLWILKGEARIGLQTAPLRYPPHGVMGWCESRPGARVLLVSTASALETQIAERSVSRALVGRDLTLTVVSANDVNAAMERVYDDFRVGASPQLILTLGESARLLRMCRFAAAAAQTLCLDVSPAQFPLTVRNSSRLFLSLDELVNHLLDLRLGSDMTFEAEDAPDAGWSTLWRILHRSPTHADR